MRRSLQVMAVTLAAAASTMALSARESYSASTVVADPDAKAEYSGQLSILTKFGLQVLSPYFINLAKEYEKLHPGVTVEVMQESDDSIKGKTKTLVASNSLPDIYFSWTGSWGGNFIRGH